MVKIVHFFLRIDNFCIYPASYPLAVPFLNASLTIAHGYSMPDPFFACGKPLLHKTAAQK